MLVSPWAHIHNEQINGVPEILDPEKHGAHRLRFQKFTNAVSVLKHPVIFQKNHKGDLVNSQGQYSLHTASNVSPPKH